MQSILVVDDSAFMRTLVSRTLGGAGYHVMLAVDGQEALEIAKQAAQNTIHLVLADQNMPRLDGIGLTRQLRADGRWQHIPILILTTDSDEEIKQAGRAAGATGWIVKPFEPSKLLGVIGQLIGD